MIAQTNDYIRKQIFEKGLSAKQRYACLAKLDPKTSLTHVIIWAKCKRQQNYKPEESAQKYEPFVDIIHRMLSYDPRKRISPSEAQSHPFFSNNDIFQTISEPYRKPRLY